MTEWQTKENPYETLMHDARYALNSHKRDLVYETFGAAKMAYALGGITWPEFRELNTMLITKGLNDPAHCKLYPY